MRFDELDIWGQLKLSGNLGNNNQFVGLSGSELHWINILPPVTGYEIYGTNYIYCDSFSYSATVSGVNLLNCYASASQLPGISETSRAAVLISPGVYELGDKYLGLSVSYVDLVGLSPNANSVLLKSSNSPYTLRYWQGVDSALCNVGITGGTNLVIQGSASTYLRWKNVVVSGDCFANTSLTNYAFEDLRGTFEDIEVKDNSTFAVASKTIDGVFDNIFSNNPRPMFNASLETLGTFSNIKIKNINNIFKNTSGRVIGNFRNFEIITSDQVFVGLTVTGRFKELEFGNITSKAFEGSLINTEFDNINFRENINTAFIGLIDGDFKNINIRKANSNIFYNTSSYLNGEFKDIKVNSCGNAFVSNENLTGKFFDIQIETSSGTIFHSQNNDIIATFSNIRIGNITQPKIVDATQKLSADVFNFSVGDTSNNNGTIFYGGTISGNYNTVIIGSNSGVDVFSADNSIEGIFEKIRVKESGGFFYTKANTNTNKQFTGDYLDIEASYISSDAFTNKSFGSFLGKFYDLTLGTITNDLFCSGTGSYNSVFSKIETGNIGGRAFTSIGGNFNSILNNVTLGKVESDFFLCKDGTFSGIYQDLQVETLKKNFFIANNGDFDVILDNFVVGDILSTGVTQAFSSSRNIIATMSNVTINNYNLSNISTSFFRGVTSYGTYTNLRLGSASSVFANSSGIDRNISIDGLFVSSHMNTKPFRGKMSNTLIDSRGFATSSIFLGTGSNIERSKFLTDQDIFSITATGSMTARISYTMTNYGITNSVINLIPPTLDRIINSPYIIK